MYSRDGLTRPYCPETETIARTMALLYGGLALLCLTGSLFYWLLF